MLTRLRVKGFKNLVDVDLRFGPFTCVAGANGVGKSNLYDAIRFLGLLADQPLLEAALSIRDDGRHSGDVRNLFTRVGDHTVREMSFSAEMVIPSEGTDDLGQAATASTTFLRYELAIGRRDEDAGGVGPLELLREDLRYIPKSDAPSVLLFAHKRLWRDEAVKGVGQRRAPFISTDGEPPQRVIRLHQDGGSRGQPRLLLARNLPRTALSVSQAAEAPTALLARREMQSWRLLQLEPSALRRPADFNDSSRLGTDGANLPAALWRLARAGGANGGDPVRSAAVNAQVANRLSALLEDVRDVWVDEDPRRELRTLFVRDRRGAEFDARSLSDGTLRFLALAVLEMDPLEHGVVCLEEPENGIHPERIPAMLQLLQDIATDTSERLGDDNPLRQVIINTHSPSVVQETLEEDLVVVSVEETLLESRRVACAAFRSLPGTWRQKAPEAGEPVAKARLLRYLQPVRRRPIGEGRSPVPGRVVDRKDLQQLLPGIEP